MDGGLRGLRDERRNSRTVRVPSSVPGKCGALGLRALVLQGQTTKPANGAGFVVSPLETGRGFPLGD